jgi:small subunit ribosomal protein S24e
MQIIERKENPLLGRVELTFEWNHDNLPTPTLSEMITAAAKAEPGSKKELVFVKNVNTRYGMPLTTGIALIYDSEESASLEPKFIVDRHEKTRAQKETGGDEECQTDLTQDRNGQNIQLMAILWYVKESFVRFVDLVSSWEFTMIGKYVENVVTIQTMKKSN